MKIVLLNGAQIPTPPPTYGSEIVTYWLAGGLAARGHEVHLIAPGGSLAPPGAALHLIPGATGADRTTEVLAWEWYADLLRAADVIHDLSATCAVVEEAYLDNPRAPTLYTRNGIDFSWPRFGRHNAVVLSASARAAAQTGTSAWAGTPWADVVREVPGVLPDPRVIPYGVDTTFYAPDDGPPEEYVLYVGRPHASKGIDLILEAARRLPDQPFVLAWRPLLPDHHAGDAGFRVLAADLPNVRVVTLPYAGHHEAKRALYQRARLMCSPNRYREAFGLTAAEALACGTAVVLGTHGAGPEIVADPAYGACVDANAPDAVDQVVAALRRTDYDRAAARARALAAYTVDRMVEAYLAAYRDVQEGRWWNR